MKKALTILAAAVCLSVPVTAAYGELTPDAEAEKTQQVDLAQQRDSSDNDKDDSGKWGLLGLTGLLGLLGLAKKSQKTDHTSGAYRATGSGTGTGARA